MILVQEAIELMHKFEGIKLVAYECPASLRMPLNKKFYTIGYGNTFYEDGTKVKLGESITLERANELFNNIVEISFCRKIRGLIKSEINNNQFSALVSFAYNIGVGNSRRGFASSTLLKKVNKNPNDLTIKNEFLKWNKARGIVLLGLTRRRISESNLYFS
jgi:lysozyme